MAWAVAAVGVGFVLVALAVYSVTLIERPYDHFVWQASAFLEGHAAIRYPAPGNDYYQDVLPVETVDGVPRGLIPFPPLPALILLPFVALQGLATSGAVVFVALAAVDVGICWWLLGRLPVRFWIRVAITLFFAFGTVFWYAAQLGTTWYQAHVAAVGLAMLAIGLAIGGDRAALDRELDPPSGRSLRAIARDGLTIDPRQFAAGLLFGLACTARLTVVFAAPFFVLVGSGGSWWRRTWSAGLGAALPVGALLVYNVVTAGDVFHPAYDYLYRLEALYYPTLGYNPEWAIEDPRYIPQNLGIMLLSTPILFPTSWPDSLGVTTQQFCTEPGAVRGLFDVGCPLAVPSDIGMSVLLTSPAYLLALPAVAALRSSRLVAGAVLAIVLITLVNLMHFSQGWVQFGYRFSNDFVPWAVLLVALGAELIARRGWRTAIVGGLVLASVAINAWGVAWGNLLQW
ncbi:MAG TPA: hypothetical protein VLA44_02690 [Clostridia bacterium]|nr:hypothetical protein [Clostridia bacterium]